MSPYQLRYPGPRWSIQFGNAAGVQKFALHELHRQAQVFMPYVIQVSQAGALPQSEHSLVIGTPQENPFIRQLVDTLSIRLPDSPEGFVIQSCPAPWDARHRMVLIVANASPGVLHGVEAFNAWVLGRLAAANLRSQKALRQAMDGIGDFLITESPRVPARGIWTWGYVMYDYQRFLDQMARLRLNELVVWNDIPPLNSQDVIDYAHARGIRVILGFHWGWGTGYQLSNPDDRLQIEDHALRHYQEFIAPLQPDGIYFQTLTEHNQTAMGDRSVAAITCDLVNRVAARLFAITPELEIQFGLHATSIGEHFSDLAALDQRIMIVWEDAGALPYSYTPISKDRGRTTAQTVDYSQRLAGLRPGTTFGMVAKGWTALNWTGEFEHHPAYLLGIRSPGFIRRRFARRKRRWGLVNALWKRYYPKAMAFYRAVHATTGGRMNVQGLIEDGMLEESIPLSVALFAETLWDPYEDPRTILDRASSPYYTGRI